MPTPASSRNTTPAAMTTIRRRRGDEAREVFIPTRCTPQLPAATRPGWSEGAQAPHTSPGGSAIGAVGAVRFGGGGCEGGAELVGEGLGAGDDRQERGDLLRGEFGGKGVGVVVGPPGVEFIPDEHEPSRRPHPIERRPRPGRGGLLLVLRFA